MLRFVLAVQIEREAHWVCVLGPALRLMKDERERLCGSGRCK